LCAILKFKDRCELTRYRVAATHHLGEEKGEYVWKSPLVDVRGMYRSALGRMGKSNGADNEVYD
jgi:hypothetical protein